MCTRVAAGRLSPGGKRKEIIGVSEEEAFRTRSLFVTPRVFPEKVVKADRWDEKLRQGG